MCKVENTGKQKWKERREREEELVGQIWEGKGEKKKEKEKKENEEKSGMRTGWKQQRRTKKSRNNFGEEWEGKGEGEGFDRGG